MKVDHSSKEGHSQKEDHSLKEDHSSKEGHRLKEDNSLKEDHNSKEDHSLMINNNNLKEDHIQEVEIIQMENIHQMIKQKLIEYNNWKINLMEDNNWMEGDKQKIDYNLKEDLNFKDTMKIINNNNLNIVDNNLKIDLS